ncbi:MAG: phosphoenolpyruvate-utilizing N-terminal domain-containing protein, partial [Dethiobacteria bacterium]
MEKTKGVILRGTGVSAGVALGPLQYVSPGKRSSSRQKTPRDPEEEKARFQQALQAVHLELDVLIARIREHDREAANIFRAYRAILEDPAFTGPVMKKIEGGIPAGGGASDHTAILCRSLGLPAVVGVGPLPAWVRKGSHTVAV